MLYIVKLNQVKLNLFIVLQILVLVLFGSLAMSLQTAPPQLCDVAHSCCWLNFIVYIFYEQLATPLLVYIYIVGGITRCLLGPGACFIVFDPTRPRDAQNKGRSTCKASSFLLGQADLKMLHNIHTHAITVNNIPRKTPATNKYNGNFMIA